MFDKADDQQQRAKACSICDNCTGQRAEYVVDARKEMYQLLAVLAEMCRQGGRITLTSLSDVARGLGGGKFNLDPNLTSSSSSSSASSGSKAGVVNVNAVAGGKIANLHRDNVDRLIVHGILSEYIGQSYQATAYTVNVYLELGNKATRFLRHPLSVVREEKEKWGVLPKVEILPALPLTKAKEKEKEMGGHRRKDQQQTVEMVRNQKVGRRRQRLTLHLPMGALLSTACPMLRRVLVKSLEPRQERDRHRAVAPQKLKMARGHQHQTPSFSTRSASVR